MNAALSVQALSSALVSCRGNAIDWVRVRRNRCIDHLSLSVKTWISERPFQIEHFPIWPNRSLPSYPKSMIFSEICSPIRTDLGQMLIWRSLFGAMSLGNSREKAYVFTILQFNTKWICSHCLPWLRCRFHCSVSIETPTDFCQESLVKNCKMR
jgi:hypothetical protein